MQNLKDIPCLILGIGNILWADEGFGVRVVEAFNDKYAFTDPNNVIADGGTLGMYLYDRICRAEKLLIFDCCDFKGKPGELRVLRNDDVKLWTATKISPHQTGMNDLLVAAAVPKASAAWSMEEHRSASSRSKSASWRRVCSSNAGRRDAALR